MNILDKGKLELVDFMGSDLSVVRAARISNGAALPDWRGVPDERLIRFLAMNKHMSPFEHAVFQFYVKAPIFVIREWQRHRTFSYNERSGRYKEFEAEFYYPATLRVSDPANKQSSTDVGNLVPEYDAMIRDLRETNDIAFLAYKRMLANGVAREIARIALPGSTYSEFIVTGNLRNWMHFLKLRNSSDAQFEIRVYAKAISDILKEKMPVSFAALEEFSG